MSKSVLLILLILFVAPGCSETMTPFKSVEEVREYVARIDSQQASFELAISDELQDPMGMNMALILDGILAKELEPDGFEQKDGYRLYRYKKFKN